MEKDYANMDKEQRIQDFQPAIKEWIEQDNENGYLNPKETDCLLCKISEITKTMIEYFIDMEKQNKEITFELEMAKLNIVCKSVLREEK